MNEAGSTEQGMPAHADSDSLFHQPQRRQWLLGAAALCTAPLLGACAQGGGSAAAAGRPLSVGALFAGRIDDRGFMESGWRGLERARAEFGVQTTFIDRVEPRRELLAAALTQLAERNVDLVIAHGGQNNEACAEVAARFPRVRFAVTQGAVTGANLTSYEVLQEESAYLAGVLAASVTRTGVVGHMSGIRVRPGLKGRAAYAAGVRATNPQVRLLTNFSGNQDDNALSRRVALAQIDAGADVIFTMLNAGRDGATEACRAKGARQIGNVVDWVERDPAVFVGSAVADVSVGVFEAVRDAKNGVAANGPIHRIGLKNLQAVRLAMRADVPPAVRERIARTSDDIVAGRIEVPEKFEGLEFATPGA